MKSLCRHLSAQEIVNWVTTADGREHTADATVSSRRRRRCVLGITCTADVYTFSLFLYFKQ